MQPAFIVAPSLGKALFILLAAPGLLAVPSHSEQLIYRGAPVCSALASSQLEPVR